MRIIRHPILEPIKDQRKISFKFNDNVFEGFEGESIAAALIANGVKVFRYSDIVKEPRSLFCGIGKCNDCNMTVNGIGNIKTCITKLEEGMIIENR